MKTCYFPKIHENMFYLYIYIYMILIKSSAGLNAYSFSVGEVTKNEKRCEKDYYCYFGANNCNQWFVF